MLPGSVPQRLQRAPRRVRVQPLPVQAGLHRCARRDGAWFQAGWVRLPPPLPMFAGLGTLVAAHGEVRFVWRGVLAMTASQFTEASKLVPTCVDMESHRVSQPCRVRGTRTSLLRAERT